MIGFFRRIRQTLLTGSKTSRYIKYAIGEIILVVIGILIALQINNWNETRKQISQEKFILEKLQVDLTSDIYAIDVQIDKIAANTNELIFCIDAMLGKSEPGREEFIRNLSSLLTLVNFDQNRTTFNNIVSSGKIEYLRNQALSDSITAYYNYQYKGWDTALRDYTRNITAPYLLNFDHIPQANVVDEGFQGFYKADISKSSIAPKSVEDYRKEVFFLNTLRQKVWNMEGQQMQYEELKKYMVQLNQMIENELATR